MRIEQDPSLPDVALEEVRPDLDAAEYNFAHFRARHFLKDVAGTLATRGVQPGAHAPDFELDRVGGGSVRLSRLRGRPVLLHFGSVT